jgi:hypothetical protein
VKYLDRLRDDAINGRTPSGYSSQQDLHPYNRNGSLKAYFARARRLVRRSRRNAGSASSSSVSGSLSTDSGEEQKMNEKMPAVEAAAASSSSENSNHSRQNPQPRFGRSMLTERLLRPTRTGEVDNVNLPWSCAIYSVVNWMVAFVDVEGIQVSHCLPMLSMQIPNLIIFLPNYLSRSCASKSYHTSLRMKPREQQRSVLDSLIVSYVPWSSSQTVLNFTLLHSIRLCFLQGLLVVMKACCFTLQW